MSRVIVVGAGAQRVAAALADASAGASVSAGDVTVLESAAAASAFDEHTDTWTLRTTSGADLRAGVIVSTQPPMLPWQPELPGHSDFRGSSFHAARWDPAFDPAGKRIAVVGADATAGHHIGRLIQSGEAASVTVFAHAPRRIVAEVPLPTTRAARWLRRRTLPTPRGQRSAATLVASPIDAVTPSGIRTRDGMQHRADAIIYGTGFAVTDETLVGAGGVTIRQAWRDGMEPYLGVAVRGFPNYFFLTGPDVVAQTGYVAEYLDLMSRTGSTRIEVRQSNQQVFNERVYLEPVQSHRVPQAYELSGDARGVAQTYDGAATLIIGGIGHPVRVRLAGHLDPIDGHYHWRGTVFEPLPDDPVRQERTATLTIGARSASARIVERTPWGTHSLAGVGAPPYDPAGL
ncbi:MAG: DUF4873 domain-containing protein [Mycobacterium sp.]|nr:DUF4873 domain-containing protein [Mycobacterium sp.]MBW0017250.1 DUF4873 domain-containing protein [Mycobacterium sp.]